MKIYFTDHSGLRQQQECDLFEIKLAGKTATSGESRRSAFRIYNKDPHESLAISFGKEIDIGEGLRDAFWSGVSAALKQGKPVFDVDEWFKGIRFVYAKN